MLLKENLVMVDMVKPNDEGCSVSDDFEVDSSLLSSPSDTKERIDRTADSEVILPETREMKGSLGNMLKENYDVGIVFRKTEDIKRKRAVYERELANVVEREFGGYIGEDKHPFCDVHYHLGRNPEAALRFLRHTTSRDYLIHSFLFIENDKD